MHICIVGTGASGWMTAHSIAQLPNVSKITLVGSDKIPTIGVYLGFEAIYFLLMTIYSFLLLALWQIVILVEH